MLGLNNVAAAPPGTTRGVERALTSLCLVERTQMDTELPSGSLERPVMARGLQRKQTKVDSWGHEQVKFNLV